MATTLSYHVNGPMLPQCNIGSVGAYVIIGECQDGVSIDLEPIKHGVKSDGGGGNEGGDVEKLALNAVATIRFRLVPYAGDYMSKLRAWAVGSTSEGILPIPGKPLGTNSLLPALYLPYGNANDIDGPWWFPTCEIVSPGTIAHRGTKEDTPEWVFRAFVFLDPSIYTSVNGRTLYTRTVPV